MSQFITHFGWNQNHQKYCTIKTFVGIDLMNFNDGDDFHDIDDYEYDLKSVTIYQ